MVELHFSPGPDGRFTAPAPTPAVPVTSNDDPIVRADSPFNYQEYNDEDDSDSGEFYFYFNVFSGFSQYFPIRKSVFFLFARHFFLKSFLLLPPLLSHLFKLRDFSNI